MQNESHDSERDVDAGPEAGPGGRRAFLGRLGGLLGASALAVLAPGLPTALAYTPRTDTLDRDGAVLDRRQLATLREVCARTLPATDTPGAAEVDVHGFIDAQLAQCHTAAEQERVRAVLDALDDDADFVGLDEQQQLRRLERLERSGLEQPGATREDFKFLKSLVVFGYFTSQVGSTLLLRFDPVPGGFDGYYRFPTDDRAWYE